MSSFSQKINIVLKHLSILSILFAANSLFGINEIDRIHRTLIIICYHYIRFHLYCAQIRGSIIFQPSETKCIYDKLMPKMQHIWDKFPLFLITFLKFYFMHLLRKKIFSLIIYCNDNKKTVNNCHRIISNVIDVYNMNS